MSSPVVTVLMSVYNTPRTVIEESVTSILRQTFRDFDFLIIDDGCDEETWRILAGYAATDSRVRILRNPENKGLGYALNRGVLAARTPLIARMDADDIALPNRLERQVKVMMDDPTVHILGTWAEDIDDYGRIIRIRKVPITHNEIRKAMPYVNPILHPTVMFRREAILSVGSYNSSRRWLQDYDLWFRCMAGGLRFQNIPEVLVRYRLGESYYRRKSWRYRRVEFHVRLQGYKILGVRGVEWMGAVVPLVLGLVPIGLAPLVHRIGKKLDPRQRVRLE